MIQNKETILFLDNTNAQQFLTVSDTFSCPCNPIVCSLELNFPLETFQMNTFELKAQNYSSSPVIVSHAN